MILRYARHVSSVATTKQQTHLLLIAVIANYSVWLLDFNNKNRLKNLTT
jgi:hypothetical protein